MEQIAVIKITKTHTGETRRNMMLPKDIWEKIVAGGEHDANVSYELRKPDRMASRELKIIQEDIKELELKAAKVSTKDAVSKEEVISGSNLTEETVEEKNSEDIQEDIKEEKVKEAKPKPYKQRK